MMSPDRLDRHDHPSDDEPVTWGHLREVELGMRGEFHDTLRRIQRVATGVYVGGALLLALITGIGAVSGFLTNRVDDNTARVERTSRAGETAICAVADYAQRQAPRISQPARAAELRMLARRMRATGIRCTTNGHRRP